MSTSMAVIVLNWLYISSGQVKPHSYPST